MALEVGQLLPDAFLAAEALDRERVSRRIRDLVSGPTLIVFLRQFGCPFCSHQVDEIVRRLPELEAAGVRLLLIGNGPVEALDAFSQRQALEGRAITLVTDPSRRAYDAVGLVHSFAAAYGPRSLLDELRIMAKGYFPRRRQGDGAQLGGAILIDDKGRVAYFKRSEHMGDLADSGDIIQSALALLVLRSAGEARV